MLQSSPVMRSLALALLGGSLTLVAILVDPSAALPSLSRSWFFSAARLADLRIALGTLGLLVAAAPWWLAFLRREAGVAPSGEREQSGADRERSGAKSRRRSWAVDALFIVALIAAAAAMWWRDDPVTDDTKYYLGEALDIAQRGGVRGLVQRCFDGTWLEDNRHPLYLALLAPWASSSNAFLVAARIVSLVGGVLTLWLSLRACRRRGGEVAAIAGGALLVTNATFVEHSIAVACESWWTACAVAAFDAATRDDARRPGARWCWVGAWVGLSFLAKGTGVLLLIAITTWIVLGQRRRAWKPLALVGIGFVATALPLLVRNQRLFGDPLWNVATRRAFWLDRFEQFLDPAVRESASAANYLASHSLGEWVVRFGTGAVKLVVHVLEACAPFTPRAAFGVPVLLLLIVGVVATTNRRTRALLAILGAIWFVSFAWYAQVTSNRRFVAVLLPVALPAVAAWTSRLRAREGALARSLGLVLAAGVVFSGGARGWPVVRALAFEPAPWNEPLRAYLHQRIGEDWHVIYLLGPSSRLGFDWDRTLSGTRRARPLDQAELDRWLSESAASRYRYLVVQWPAESQRLGDTWVVSGAGGELRAARVPPGWEQVAAFPPDAPRALVFERR